MSWWTHETPIFDTNSNFSHSNDWSRDSNNFVAKSYMEENTPREMYFDDVKLQMDAKLWGEEYSRHNPPKKVDIFMMAVIELYERPGSPLFHVEHYIDGDYIKYNSHRTREVALITQMRAKATPLRADMESRHLLPGHLTNTCRI